MTTTAHEDQFTDAPEPVRQTYSTADILRRNVANAEKEMQRQAERAESYAETLRSLASYVGAGGYNADTVDAGVFEEKIRWGIGEIMKRVAPVPSLQMSRYIPHIATRSGNQYASVTCQRFASFPMP